MLQHNSAFAVGIKALEGSKYTHRQSKQVAFLCNLLYKQFIKGAIMLS